MTAQDGSLYRSNHRTQGASFDLRLAFAAFACFVLMGCAATTAPTKQASAERGPAKCPPHIGQTEKEFLSCACFWDYASPTENVQLMSQAETKSGSKRVYSCQDVGAYSYTVTVVNGKVSDLSGPSR